jgi:hypothetical protein
MMVLFYVTKEGVVSFLVEVRRKDSLDSGQRDRCKYCDIQFELFNYILFTKSFVFNFVFLLDVDIPHLLEAICMVLGR